MLGSTLLQVVRPAGRVVVRPSGEDAPPGLSAGRVVVSVDDSTRSQRAVDFAFVQADSRGIGLTAVLSWLGPDLDVGVAPPHEWEQAAQDERALLAETLSGRCAQYPGVDVIEKTAPDDPIAALADESRGAELLVAGSHGRGGRGGMVLGSVSQALLHRAHCPLAVVLSR